MGNLIPHNTDLREKGHDVFWHGSHWMKKWDPYLDRLEEFASNFGVGYAERMGAYTKRWDSGLLAFGGGLIALIALALVQ